MTAPQFVYAGRIVRPHGILGEVKVEGDPDVLGVLPTLKRVYVGRDRAPRAVHGCRFHQNAALLRLEGENDRNAAEALRGEELHILGDELPELEEGEYYTHELIGLRVIDADGRDLGELTDVLGTGANDVYVIQMPGRELLLPAIESVVRDIDLEKGVVTVVVPEGL